MTTVGLELTNFIDPSLTWKTVSKGRNTSRRSRRANSKTKTHRSDQCQGKKNLEQSSGTQSSESDKSDISVQGRGFGNMEHIPIKKRRFLFRSPTPPPQSPNQQEESQEVDAGQCNLEPQSYSNGNTEPVVTGTDISTGSVCNDENTARSFNGAPVSDEDLSGIAILAAVACSGGLDCAVGDVAKSKTGGKLKQEGNESFAFATNSKENIAVSQSTEFFEKATGKVKEEICVPDMPSNSVQSVRLEDSSEDVARNDRSKLSRTTPIEPLVSPNITEKSIESCGLPDAENKDGVCAEDPSSIKTVNQTKEDSGVQRGYRLHWDLNTIMDEWDHPVEDTFVDSTPKSLEVSPANATGFQKSENLEASAPPERPLATEKGDLFTPQAVAHMVPKAKAVPNCGGFNKSPCSLEMSSYLGTSLLGGNWPLHSACSHAVETTTNSVMESKTQQDVAAPQADSDIDQSLSLGMNGTKNLMSNKGDDTKDFENLIKVAKESSLPTLKTEVREIDFSLVPLSGNVSSDVKGADFCHTVKGGSLTCQPVSSYEFVSLGAALPGKVLPCIANDTDAGKLRPSEHVNSVEAKTLVQSTKTHSCGYDMPMVTPLAIIRNEQAMDVVSAKEIKENPVTSDVPKCDNLTEIVPCVHEAVMPVNSAGNHVKHLGFDTSENHGGHGSHISSEVSSQVTENTANVANIEGGYDSHLEDGELRESLGPCWEHNEVEDGDTEHVDYDSDDREEIFSEAANDSNDSVRLSGEVLGEKQGCRLDKFSSADNEPVRDKIIEENCSPQLQNCFSTADAKAVESIKLDSPTPVAFSEAQPKGENRLEGDCKDCGRSDVEADRPGIEYDFDAPRNCRGASASGSDMQFSDRNVDCIRRSRSSNFDSVHPTDGSGESMRQPPMQMERFGGRAWNVELKSDVGDSNQEEDGERIVRVQEGTSPRVCRPRIISTSRSGYNPMRRGSSGERDNGYGMGMSKGRGMSPDNNTRNRFGMNRGFRDGYRRPGMYDGGKPNGPMSNQFGKRDRSFSPIGNRMDSHFTQNHRKSRSRSRTRSPDFRSDARMGRTRLPYQQPGHVADHSRERRSPPVRMFNQRQRFDNVGSPGRLRSDDCMRPMMRPVRFHDTTTSGRDGFEDGVQYRRKPHFMRNNRRSSRSRSRSCSPDFRPDNRMGGMRAPYQPPPDHIRNRRMRSDDCMRPMIRPRRFNDNSQPDRGNGYNNGGDEYRRKPRNIFERIHPVRNYDAEGDGRRFQYNEQDDHGGGQNFRRNDNYMRGGGGDRRPGEGFRREERGNIRYNNNNNSNSNNNNNNSDRPFYSGPKQFGGMPDYADDTKPRGARP
ncbi:hypothetical protein RND81_12G111600 [Saponaria officinalis]|uniref:Uncharacterized protein n=1 Tax=Saponaria officinalis TaxID=3572 RepID=A0AAW1H980_SAPOF